MSTRLESRALCGLAPALLALAALALSLLLPPGVRAAEVSVAAAANLQPALARLLPAFERATGHKAVPALGSTGRFHAQVRNGAPFHVLLAADQETPRRLEQDGHAVAGSRFTFATGRLVLWSAAPDGVDPQGQVLRTGHFGRLAVADPRVSPYGRAAVQVMEQLGVSDALRPRLVQGESIGQALQFVRSGNAQLGFVALSQVQLDGRLSAGSAWLVPPSLHEPLHHDAVLLVRGRDNPAATALLAFLRSEEARAILRSHGYAA